MTQTAKQQANYEALISLVQMGIRRMNDVVYEVPSTTSGLHIVTVLEGQVTFCSNCKGWSQWGHCLHAIATIRFIEEEQRVAAASAVKAAEQIVSETSTVEVKEVASVRRGYLTRAPEVRRDEKYGIILR